MQSGEFACRCVILYVCVQPHVKSYAWIYKKFLPLKVGVGPVSRRFHFGVIRIDLHSFGDYSHPARSFRHIIHCSVGIVRDTAKVTIEH